MAKLLAEEPDALMHARPDLWEPWRATAKATRPAARSGSPLSGGSAHRDDRCGEPGVGDEVSERHFLRARLRFIGVYQPPSRVRLGLVRRWWVRA